MELSTIVRFHAKEGQEEGVAAALRDQFAPVLAEPGCTRIRGLPLDARQTALLHPFALARRGGVRDPCRAAAYGAVPRTHPAAGRSSAGPEPGRSRFR